MIIGSDFIWLHIPKCAGMTMDHVLKTVFAADPAIEIDPPDPHGAVVRHDTVVNREKRANRSLAGRERVANLRRLPSWLLSKVFHEEKLSALLMNQRAPKGVADSLAAAGPVFHTRTDMLEGTIYEQNGDRNRPDTYLLAYESPKVDQWIRTEHIVEDFTAVFSRYAKLDPTVISAGFSEPRNRNDYTKDLAKWFTRSEMRELYAKNPIWAELERRLYGNLLFETMR
jgi:hypothetical protein